MPFPKPAAVAALALSISLCALPAAAGFHNGAEYLKWPRMLKIIYVTGVYDGMESAFNGETGAPSPGKSALPICIAKEVRAEQMTDAVTKYIRSRPDDRSIDAADLVKQALMAQYPCAAPAQ